MAESANSAGLETETIIADIPCPFCACLCDDLQATVSDGRVDSIDRACPSARPWFLGEPAAERPICHIDGKPATIDEALTRATKLLKGSRYPLVYGLSRATCEAQAVAVDIADLIAGVLDTPADRAALDALQSVGEATCTLGEIRNRADLIVAWNIDPLTTHPRFFERYAPASESRSFIAVSAKQSATGRQALGPIEIREEGEFDAVTALVALAKGVKLDATTVHGRTGVELSVWRGLFERMKSARYGVLLCGDFGEAPSARATRHSLATLIRLVNEQTRFALFTLPSTGNSVGAANVLAWKTRLPTGIALTRGIIEGNHNELVAGRLLPAGEFDAALVICDDLPRDSLIAARDRKLPLIAVDWRPTSTTAAADIAIPIAAPGVESGGTMFRCDGVPLALRPPISSPLPADCELLRTLAKLLEPTKQLIGRSLTNWKEGFRPIGEIPRSLS